MCLHLLGQYVEARVIADQMMFLQQQEPGSPREVMGGEARRRRRLPEFETVLGRFG